MSADKLDEGRMKKYSVVFLVSLFLGAPVWAEGLLGNNATANIYGGGGVVASSAFYLDKENNQDYIYARFFNYLEIKFNNNQIIYDFNCMCAGRMWSDGVVSLNKDGLYIEAGSEIEFEFHDGAYIKNAYIGSETNYPKLPIGSLTFNNNSVAINWTNMRFDNNTTIVLNVETAVASIPEPATYALMIAGLAAVAGAARLRRR
ncbi:PEP-CTERM sorting domain-containing protein [uncultured Aquincola sp.]|uniref:PEP-CTERM sorting domain-containing protein n=1 Tax=uncultured Aquincola sp. TaxID=886556 RepID=UPI0032B20C7C|tara:strand:+ start:2074 stop:2682 length:609 start_codon:yes stop_codon:yes gene_type:complete